MLGKGLEYCREDKEVSGSTEKLRSKTHWNIWQKYIYWNKEEIEVNYRMLKESKEIKRIKKTCAYYHMVWKVPHFENKRHRMAHTGTD